jgi:hypothetical protein
VIVVERSMLGKILSSSHCMVGIALLTRRRQETVGCLRGVRVDEKWVSMVCGGEQQVSSLSIGF